MKKLVLTDDDYNELITNLRYMGEINRNWAQNELLTESQRQRAVDRYMALGKLYQLLQSQD